MVAFLKTTVYINYRYQNTYVRAAMLGKDITNFFKIVLEPCKILKIDFTLLYFYESKYHYLVSNLFVG